MALEWTHKGLFEQKHDAAYMWLNAVKVWAEKQEIFNFFDLFWWRLQGIYWIYILLSILTVFLILKYTAIAVEYIAEGIQILSEWMKLSESLAAVTLLAFANGAGDVITALVASGAEGGISYNIGALFGAGLFVCTIVVAVCILMEDKKTVFDSQIIFRDIGFYLVATIVTIIFAWIGVINIFESCIFLLIYVGLVFTVVAQDMAKAKRGAETGPNELMSNPEEEHDKLVDDDEKTKKKPEIDTNIKPGLSLGFLDKSGNLDGLSIIKKLKLDSYIGLMDQKRKYNEERKNKPIKDKTIFEKFIYLIELPFNALFYITVLPYGEHNYSYYRCLIVPIPGALFIAMVIMKTFTITLFANTVIIAAIILVIFFLLLSKDQAPKWMIVMTIWSLISSLIWSYFLIGLLIDMLGAIGIIFNINETYLGLTILAIGNALPDALTTIALWKQGAGTMAITGGYAAQLFGYLVGFGLAMLKLTILEGSQVFSLFDPKKLSENFLDILVIGFALLALASTFIQGIAFKYVMSKKFAVYLLILYAVFILWSTAYTIKAAATK